MVTGFLGTTVVIDALRGYAPAVAWLAQQSYLGISSVVWLEILDGVYNKPKQQIALKFLRRFERFDPLADDFKWAIEQSVKFTLSHSVGGMGLSYCIHLLSTTITLIYPQFETPSTHSWQPCHQTLLS